MSSRAFQGGPSLHDEICPRHPGLTWLEKMSQKRSRSAKWDVPEHPEWFGRKRHAKEVTCGDDDVVVVREVSDQANGERRIKLDGDDLTGTSHELGGQDAVAGSDLYDQI
jgi:hypothetical protein